MTTFPVCLIERNMIFSEGVKSLLAAAGFTVRETYPDAASALKNSKNHQGPRIILVGLDENKSGGAHIVKSIKSSFPNSPVALMTGQKNYHDLQSIIDAGADGYILRSTSSESLVNALNILARGERFFSADALHSLFERSPANSDKDQASSARILSVREKEILSHLSNGSTNKQIARQLDIAEATVKVHIKTVLRKLGLANRTQAAVWTVNGGLTTAPATVRKTARG